MVLHVLRGDAPARTRQVENVLVGIRDRGISWLGKGILKKVISQNVGSALPGATDIIRFTYPSLFRFTYPI